MDTIEKLGGFFEDPYSRARELKEEGNKVFAATPMYFPEELVHAGGAFPIVLQDSAEPITYGYSYIYPFFCGFVRGNVDLAVKRKLDFCDALVIDDMCSQSRTMIKVLKRRLPNTPTVFMQWPLEASDRFFDTCVERLAKCRKDLEKLLGRKIEDKALEESFALYNQHRAVLRSVYELRKRKPWALGAKDYQALVMSSMLMPKEEHIPLVKGLLPELEKIEAPAETGVKLYLAGHLCNAVKIDILDLIEEVGATVVGDDLYTGYRYYSTDIPGDRPPLEALAWRYLNLEVPCPTRTELKIEWADYAVSKARECEAAGIVVLMNKQCGPQLLYQSFLKDVVDASGMPHILIETEHDVVSLEPVKTRLEAFVEMVKKGG